MHKAFYTARSSSFNMKIATIDDAMRALLPSLFLCFLALSLLPSFL